MEQHDGRNRWAVILFAAVFAALVGFFAYNAGVAHGIAAGQQVSGGAGAFPPYGWYRPWGFGGFGFFFPFLFFGFWFLLLRGLFWRGRWGRYGCYGGGYYRDLPPTFDDWHSRAHERMTKEPAGPPSDDDRSRR